ncbi:MAG TPA: outer membrane protein assembly factor BamA [Bacteroidales bacterium]|nr:outer membrane protein assembly factor BamA [Bacteroidales bacterium]
MRLLFRYIPLLFSLLIAIPAFSQVNYQVASVEFKGNETIKNDVLAEQMNTRGMNLKERLIFWKGTPEYSSLILENDLERLKSYYQRNGFLEPDINRELMVNDKKEKLSVVIHINEGDAFKLKEVIFREHGQNNAGLTDALPADISLQGGQGQRFRDRDVFSTVEYLKQLYRDSGYPFVSVTNEVKLDQSSNEASVTIHIYPGEKAVFGEVFFEGDSLVPTSFISRQITFNQGDTYAQKDLEKSQQEIFETGLFNYAIIRARKDSIIDGSLPILVRVKELPQWSFEGGIGYGTEDRFRVSAELLKRQFFGGARKFILQAKRSYYVPVSLDVKFIQPDLLQQEVDLAMNPFFSREREESYEVDRMGAGLTLQKKFSSAFSSYLTYTLQQDNLLDKTQTAADTAIPVEQIVNNKSGITLGLTYNSTDNMFEPAKGWQLKGYFTYMGLGFESDNHYYQFGADARHFREIAPDFILAGRVRGGVITPLRSNEDTPIEDRYFIGGASSLRGWQRNSISPRNTEGEAIGGNTLFESSIELRFPIYEILKGTAFIDAGNVWRESYEFALSDLYYNTGAGLRVTTPVGPVRLDAAFPLFQGDFRMQFFISLGHAF